jgi:hypothetical protein
VFKHQLGGEKARQAGVWLQAASDHQRARRDCWPSSSPLPTRMTVNQCQK